MCGCVDVNAIALRVAPPRTSCRVGRSADPDEHRRTDDSDASPMPNSPSITPRAHGNPRRPHDLPPGLPAWAPQNPTQLPARYSSPRFERDGPSSSRPLCSSLSRRLWSVLSPAKTHFPRKQLPATTSGLSAPSIFRSELSLSGLSDLSSLRLHPPSTPQRQSTHSTLGLLPPSRPATLLPAPAHRCST